MKNKGRPDMSKKPKRLNPLLIVVLLVVALSVVVLTYTKRNNTAYATLVEDVNNNCARHGSDTVSTAASQKLVDIQVPADEVNNYLEAAIKDGRCVYYKDELTQKQQTPNRNCKKSGGAEICANDYIDLSESEAVNKAKRNNHEYRVVERDGKSLPINLDLNEYRLNFSIENGVVTSVQFY